MQSGDSRRPGFTSRFSLKWINRAVRAVARSLHGEATASRNQHRTSGIGGSRVRRLRASIEDGGTRRDVLASNMGGDREGACRPTGPPAAQELEEPIKPALTVRCPRGGRSALLRHCSRNEVRLMAGRTARQPTRDRTGEGEAHGDEQVAEVALRARCRADRGRAGAAPQPIEMIQLRNLLDDLEFLIPGEEPEKRKPPAWAPRGARPSASGQCRAPPPPRHHREARSGSPSKVEYLDRCPHQIRRSPPSLGRWPCAGRVRSCNAWHRPTSRRWRTYQGGRRHAGTRRSTTCP